jgi:hypothetical protein
MDIRVWLQNTVDREPPDARDGGATPHHPQPQLGEADAIRTWHRRKRRPASSDASHGALRSPRRTKHRHRHTGAPPSDARARSPEDSHRHSGGDGRNRMSSREPVSRPFERRARHKTRPERYEHTSRDKSNPHGEKNVSVRKHNRRGIGVRTTELLDRYQPNNGPVNGRLTV